MNATWSGRDCKFVWRRASNTGSSEFGSEPFGANSGALDPALDYLVQIFRTNGKLLRTEYVKDNEYIYSYERNFEDTGGVPVRDFTIKVWARNAYVLSAQPAQLPVSNPQSLPPTAVALVGSFKSIFLQIVPPTDPDWAGTLVFMSTVPGFVPSGTEAGQGNCIYSGSDKLIVVSAASGTTYYLQYASFDAFGRDNLVLSGEISVATGTVANADIAAGTITADRLLVSILSAITADAGEITAGSIRGVNVNASSHTTKGSYLTSAPAGGAATLNVKNTADFSSGGGSGWIIDTTNDRDAFAYTGKTATTLTGCSGVLAHNSGATIIPKTKCIVLDGATNEIRFFADRGDGIIEEIACIGINSVAGDLATASFGSLNSTIGVSGVVAYAGNFSAIQAITSGGANPAIDAIQSSSGTAAAVRGGATHGPGGDFGGNADRGNLFLQDANGSTFPTSVAAKQLAQVGGRLYYSNGALWLPLTQPYFESSELTITDNTLITANHGLPFIPKLVRCVARCKTAEFNWSVGDEILIDSTIDLGGALTPEFGVYANSTVVGIAHGNTLVADHSAPGTRRSITNANWKFLLRAA